MRRGECSRSNFHADTTSGGQGCSVQWGLMQSALPPEEVTFSLFSVCYLSIYLEDGITGQS